MKIRWKIDLAISGAFLIGLTLAGVGADLILKRNAVDESLSNARVMIESASAIRKYTAESIKPLLEQQMKITFLGLTPSLPLLLRAISRCSMKNFRTIHIENPQLIQLISMTGQ
jgi:hypothetical protein